MLQERQQKSLNHEVKFSTHSPHTCTSTHKSLSKKTKTKELAWAEWSCTTCSPLPSGAGSSVLPAHLSTSALRPGSPGSGCIERWRPRVHSCGSELRIQRWARARLPQQPPQPAAERAQRGPSAPNSPAPSAVQPSPGTAGNGLSGRRGTASHDLPHSPHFRCPPLQPVSQKSFSLLWLSRSDGTPALGRRMMDVSAQAAWGNSLDGKAPPSSLCMSLHDWH